MTEEGQWNTDGGDPGLKAQPVGKPLPREEIHSVGSFNGIPCTPLLKSWMMIYRRHFPSQSWMGFRFLVLCTGKRRESKDVSPWLPTPPHTHILWLAWTWPQKIGALVRSRFPSSWPLGENKVPSRWILTKGPNAWETNFMFASIKQGIWSSPLPSATHPSRLRERKPQPWVPPGLSWVGSLWSLEWSFLLQTLPGNNLRRRPDSAARLGEGLSPHIVRAGPRDSGPGHTEAEQVPTSV